MTSPPDAFRSGTDVVRLRPGQRFEASWGIAPLADGPLGPAP
jgi:aldose 1-epimerase